MKKRINGKNVKTLEFFKTLEQGEVTTYAYVYFNDMSHPIKVTYEEGKKYLNAVAKANDIDTKEDPEALVKLEENNLFRFSNVNEATLHYEEEILKIGGEEAEIKEEVKSKTNKFKITFLSFTGTLLVLIGAGYLLSKKPLGCSAKANTDDDKKQENDSRTTYFDSLLNKLEEGPKKTAIQLVHGSTKSFNDTLSGNIMKEGEDKRLAHSWEENMASYLAFNQFTDEELFQIFDTYKINATDLYDQLKLSNMKEMLYYARATESSGRDYLIQSEEGKTFFRSYEDLVLEYNRATTKEEKTEIAKEFFAKVRNDFPITSEDKVGFIHTEKAYEDYHYAVTPMISAMEIMNRNLGVSLTNQEIEYFNELGMCNFAEEKFEDYEDMLSDRQNIEIAKEELRSESQVEVSVSNNNEVSLIEKVSYIELKEAAIDTIVNYDLSSEKNDVGTIDGYWESVTVNSIKHLIDSSSSNVITPNGNIEILTEEDLKNESSEIREEAEKQKQEIIDKIEKENSEAKAESDKKKEELEKEIASEKEKLEEEIKNDNAWLEENKNTSSETSKEETSSKPSEEVAGRPNREDVNSNIDIDDEYVDDNGNLEFDGPIYDKDGNIIDIPTAKDNTIVALTEESEPVRVYIKK